MTHWTPNKPHLSELPFGFYLLAKQQFKKAAQNQIFFGMFFAKIAIIRTTKGKD